MAYKIEDLYCGPEVDVIPIEITDTAPISKSLFTGPVTSTKVNDNVNNAATLRSTLPSLSYNAQLVYDSMSTDFDISQTFYEDNRAKESLKLPRLIKGSTSRESKDQSYLRDDYTELSGELSSPYTVLLPAELSPDTLLSPGTPPAERHSQEQERHGQEDEDGVKSMVEQSYYGPDGNGRYGSGSEYTNRHPIPEEASGSLGNDTQYVTLDDEHIGQRSLVADRRETHPYSNVQPTTVKPQKRESGDRKSLTTNKSYSKEETRTYANYRPSLKTDGSYVDMGPAVDLPVASTYRSRTNTGMYEEITHVDEAIDKLVKSGWEGHEKPSPPMKTVEGKTRKNTKSKSHSVDFVDPKEKRSAKSKAVSLTSKGTRSESQTKLPSASSDKPKSTAKSRAISDWSNISSSKSTKFRKDTIDASVARSDGNFGIFNKDPDKNISSKGSFAHRVPSTPRQPKSLDRMVSKKSSLKPSSSSDHKSSSKVSVRTKSSSRTGIKARTSSTNSSRTVSKNRSDKVMARTVESRTSKSSQKKVTENRVTAEVVKNVSRFSHQDSGTFLIEDSAALPANSKPSIFSRRPGTPPDEAAQSKVSIGIYRSAETPLDDLSIRSLSNTKNVGIHSTVGEQSNVEKEVSVTQDLDVGLESSRSERLRTPTFTDSHTEVMESLPLDSER